MFLLLVGAGEAQKLDYLPERQDCLVRPKASDGVQYLAHAGGLVE